MPVIYYKSMPHAEVALWKASEGIEFFTKKLNEQDYPIEQVVAIAHPEKKLQWLASRFLLSEVYPAAIPLYNDRKPYLFNGPHISFSHSKNIVAIQVSAYKAGIDIQWPDPKLKIISSRFLADGDLENTAAETELEALSIIWTIKEAVFKYYGTQMPFKKISITQVDAINKEAWAVANRNGKQQHHKLEIDRVEGMYLAYIKE